MVQALTALIYAFGSTSSALQLNPTLLILSESSQFERVFAIIASD